MLTEPEARTRYLSDDELNAVLSEAGKHSPVMLAAVTVALATGVRQGEMLRLTWADVDFARSTIRLLLTKNGQARAVISGDRRGRAQGREGRQGREHIAGVSLPRRHADDRRPAR